MVQSEIDIEIRVTPLELVTRLKSDGKLELPKGKKLVIYDMDLQDFFDLAKHSDANQRLLVLHQMMSRYCLEINMTGSVLLGALNVSDYSWVLEGGAKATFLIQAKVAPVRRSLSDLAAFLHLLPKGQAFALKPFQDLFLTGLSTDALLDYYKFSMENADAPLRENRQDVLFCSECQLLTEKNQTLKVYGWNASRIDRVIDINAGGILFKVEQSGQQPAPQIILALSTFQQK